MSTDGESLQDDMAETAYVGEAGAPRGMDPDGPQEVAQDATPSAEQLDERDRTLARPRKPMGPDQGTTPETAPDES